MYTRRKLKPDTSINGFIPLIAISSVFLLSLILFGKSVALNIGGTLILTLALFTLIPYSKTKNLGFLISSIYLFVLSLLMYTIPPKAVFASYPGKLPPHVGLLVVLTLGLAVWLINLMVRRKIKWRGREIYELAAEGLEESSNTFTQRPRPIEKLNYTKAELRDFGDFLKKNLISMTVMDDTRLLILPLLNSEEFPLMYQFSFPYENRSWVSFDFEGNITAKISKKDYLYYKDDLPFDQLCDSLGKLYIEFFQLYIDGKGVRIIDKMDDLKISIVS